MTGLVFLAWVVRLLHIASAICGVGGPFFVRFALLPAAAKTLDEGAHLKLRQAVNARWKFVVYALITVFILTGTFTFLVPVRGPGGNLITARWKEFTQDDKRLYHMLFGVKVLCAFGVFFLASALAGNSATFAVIRKNARTSVTLLLLLAGLVVVCSTLLRFLPLHGVVTVVP